MLALVHQLGDILGRKVLFLPGLGLFQGQLLGVAVRRGLGLLDGVAVELGLFFLVLPGFGFHAVPGQVLASIAQLLIQVDLALLRVLFLVAGLLGLGLSFSLCLAGALVGGDLGTRGGGAAVGVGGGLAHLYLSGGGVGVHGLGLGGLTDLARLASLLILLAGVDDVALGDGGVGVLGVRLGVLVVDLYILRLRVRGKGRLLFLFVGFLVHRGLHLVLALRGVFFLALQVGSFFQSGLGVGVLAFRVRRGVYCVSHQGLGGNAGGKCYGHGSEFQLFVRHD